MAFNIRRVYLYLTSLIGLILIIIGTVQLVNLALKTWVFTKADEQFHYCIDRETKRPLKEGEEVPKPTEEEKAEQRRQCEEEKTARRQADAARSIAFIVVGAPVWFYHWGKVKQEKDV